jgi:hypothetical protein
MTGAMIGATGGLGALKMFPMLTSLTLSEAKMVDTDLGPLTFLPNLQTLHLGDTGVSQKGVEVLMDACPHLKTVHWGPKGARLKSSSTATPVKHPREVQQAVRPPLAPTMQRPVAKGAAAAGSAPRGGSGQGAPQRFYPTPKTAPRAPGDVPQPLQPAAKLMPMVRPSLAPKIQAPTDTPSPTSAVKLPGAVQASPQPTSTPKP